MAQAWKDWFSAFLNGVEELASWTKIAEALFEKWFAFGGFVIRVDEHFCSELASSVGKGALFSVWARKAELESLTELSLLLDVEVVCVSLIVARLLDWEGWGWGVFFGGITGTSAAGQAGRAVELHETLLEVVETLNVELFLGFVLGIQEVGVIKDDG